MPMPRYPFKAIETLEELCTAQRARVEHLLDRLDLARPELAEVAAARGQDDLPRACEALLAHFARRDCRAIVDALLEAIAIESSVHDGGAWAESLTKADLEAAPSQGRHEPADDVLADAFTMQEVRATQRRRDDGHFDWRWHGPRSDIEWAFFINRHRYIVTLLKGFCRTGRGDYLAKLDELLHDWCLLHAKFPCPEAKEHSEVWRELEVGLRLCEPWPLAFALTQGRDEIRPATRLLMLCSLAEQGAYLRRFHFPKPHNHLAMELGGLTAVAALLPELRDAGEWLDHAAAKMAEQPAGQVYPDGAQKELSASYHLVTLLHFERFALLMGAVDEARVPASLRACLRGMWDYAAGTVAPSGEPPLNNDSDRLNLQTALRQAASRNGEPRWLYVASGGAEGERPADPPSRLYPWAGQLVSRGGWDEQADWSFFDFGPLGISGHQHRDRLHLSVAVGGRDVLVDSGRYWYRPDIFRQYYLGSSSHNVVLIDGAGQRDDVETVESPHAGPAVVTPEFDWAVGRFEAGYLAKRGRVVHSRGVLYVRGRFWIVVDRIETDRPRTIQPLWHFHPHCRVHTDGLEVWTDDAGAGNLRIVPAGLDGRLDIVRGQTDSDAGTYRMWKADVVRGPDDEQVQGWYSPTYNVHEPAPCAVYHAAVDGDVTFAWLLAPARGTPPAASLDLHADADRLRMDVTCGDDRTAISLSLDDDRVALERLVR